MPKTLYAKLALWLIILLTVVGVLYGFLSTSMSMRYQEELTESLNRHLARNIVADRNLVAEGHLNEAALKETFGLYMTINPSIEIYLLDVDGNILSYSADPGKIKRNRVSLGPIREFLSGSTPNLLLGDDPRSHDRRKAFSVTPVPSAENLQGYLYVVLRGEQYETAESMVRDSIFLRMGAWAMLASLGIGLVAGLVVFRLLTRRLQRLSELMAGFVDGGFANPVRYEPRDPALDEVDRLGVTFDQMAQRIHRQIDQLQEQDALRRRMVAQVSHDLRTPLASMRGYLETLQMKGESLDEDKRESFLQIAIDQGERLSRQVDELFELASLDAREYEPAADPFQFAELLYDGTQKHRNRAEGNRVELTVSAPPDLPFAIGDMGLTERVVDNLLDNALRHTPAGGRIEVSAKADGDVIEVAVADTGPGIPDTHLPHVFEPLFRGKPGPHDREHAGLGLAIAKRITELQKGDIWAENRPEGGARFVFTLPLNKPHPNDVMKT